MKTVLVLRHAEYAWNEGTSDHEKRLSPRGEEVSASVGRFLARTRAVPKRALVSSAERARSTFEIARRAGGWSCEGEVAPALYESSVEIVLDVLRSQPDDFDAVLLIGHQPTWGDLVRVACGGGVVGFGTATIARLDFPAPRWSLVEPGTAQLTWLVPGSVIDAVAGAAPGGDSGKPPDSRADNR